MAEPAAPARRTAPLAPRRRWGWERVAALSFLIYVAGGVGTRPQAVGELARGCGAAAVAEHALALPDGPRRAAAWSRLADYRPRDVTFQAVVVAQVYRSERDANTSGRALNEAVDRLTALSGAAERDPVVALSVGETLIQEEQPAAAAPLLEAGLRRCGGDDALEQDLRRALAAAYDKLDRRAAAEQLLLGLVDRDRLDAAAMNNLAYHYAQCGEQLDYALALARRAAWQARGTALFYGKRGRLGLGDCLDTLGWVQYKRSEPDAARRSLSEAVSLTSARPRPEILCHLARVLYDRNDDAGAAALVEQALGLDPAFAPALQLHELLRGAPNQGQEIG